MPLNDDLIPQADEEEDQLDLIPERPQPRANFGQFLARKYGGGEVAGPENGARGSAFGKYLAQKYGAPEETGQPAEKPKKEPGNFGRGLKESFQQIPQLGQGVKAIAGATIESIAGEGGFGTALKKSGVEGFQKAGEEIAAKAKDTDSWNFSWDKARTEGDLGALVDWATHGLGYVGGQALQMLATAGIGAVAGKVTAQTAAKKIVEGMVGREAAKIAATEQGKRLGRDEIQKAATRAVTDKFAKIGTNAALGATAVGMEGGEIGGDLAAKSVEEGRPLTGEELGKGFAATLAAGGLEFVGDRLGLDVLLGKSPLLKPAAAKPGLSGRAARGTIAAAGTAPIEAGTEFGQTLLEEYGKGNNPFSPETIHHAQDAAALGALGGGLVGGVGGVMSSPRQPEELPPAPAPEAPPALQLPHLPDAPLLVFPDGSVGTREQAEEYINSLPDEQQRMEARARFMGYAHQPADERIAGMPVNQMPDSALQHAASRGGARARALATAELQRRAQQGVDPAIANAPEDTVDAVSRIIGTAREKAQELREEAINPLVPDIPIPEPVATLDAQITALAEGRKPGVLLTPGEPAPTAIPPGVKVADIPGQGTLLYRDDATLQAALSGQMGVALGYGIDQKPAGATDVVTARAPDGTVIQDVATDGRPQVQQAAQAVAGPEGTVETRPIEQALGERTGTVPAPVNEPTIKHNGDTWRVLSLGRREGGKVLAHLASTTRGNQQKNGHVPVQINDWIDERKITAARKTRPFKVDSKISQYHDPINESLRARVEDALNNETDSYELSHDGFISLPKEDKQDNQRGSLKVEDDGRVRMIGDSGFGWGSTMTKTSIEKTLKDWLKYVEQASQKPQKPQKPERDLAPSPEQAEAAQAVGVDEAELGKIAGEFNDAQAAMVEGGQAVTNVFVAPKKNEIVRLGDKVKVYHKDHGWMTPEEARARIAEWKAHAKGQGKDDAIRSENSQRVVLSLFDLTGEWSKPWEDAGYQVYRFDIQDDPDVGDVNNFSTEFFGDWFGDFEGQDIYAILAACPCTDFAVSGARHFAAKDKDGRTVASVRLVHQTLAAIEYFKPAVWAVENPVGRIEKLGGLPPWRLSFDPNHLGDPYTKKTLIWGRFNADLPIAPVEPTEGSKMHQKYGGKSLATKNARSVTPEGFSYGFFMANNAHDHPAMAIANKYDRLDRGLIEQAVKAGVTEQQIDEAVEDFYYMDLDDDAANQAIRDLIPAQSGQPADKAGKLKQEIRKFLEGKRDTPPDTPSELIAQLRKLDVQPEQIAQAEKEMAEGDDTLARDLIRIWVYHDTRQYIESVQGSVPGSERRRIEADERITSGERRELLDLADNLKGQAETGTKPGEDDHFYYSTGVRGMKSDGTFTKEKRDWITFTRAEATRMDEANIKPHGATERGIFIGTVTGGKLAKPKKPVTPSPELDRQQAQWWQELTPHGRRLVMQAAGVNLPDRVVWNFVKGPDKDKLWRNRGAAEDVTPSGPVKQTGLAYLEPAIQAVTDYMEDRITKDELVQKFADLGMTDGQVSSVTDRATTKDWRMVDRWNVQRIQGRVSSDDIRGDLSDFNPPSTPATTEKTSDTPVPETKKEIPAETAGAKPERFANNKIFTADKVAAARARIKAKLGNINSGIDPELMIDGMTVAGGYIEEGVRDFATYAKMMVDDFGHAIKPYLLSFYEGARAYPGLDKTGMTSAEDAAAQHQAMLTPEVKATVKEVIGEGVVTPKKARAKPNGHMTLTQDWGVEYIDGYTRSPTGKNQDTDYGLKGGIKDDFLAETKKYLNQVAGLLAEAGFEPYKDRKGRTNKAVDANEAGPAVSGDVDLTMRRGGVGVYAHIGVSALRGMVGHHPQGVAIMIRATSDPDKDRYASGFKGATGNIWLAPDINATQLFNELLARAERLKPATIEQTDTTGAQDENRIEPSAPAGAGGDKPLEGASPQDVPGTQGSGAAGSGSNQGGGENAGRAGIADGTGVSAGGSLGSGAGAIPVPAGGRGRIGGSPDDGTVPGRPDSAGNAEQVPAGRIEAGDYRITESTRLGEGGARGKYNGNVAAIRLMKDLRDSGRKATPDEQDTLARYVGWGGIPQVFDKDNAEWSKQHAELKELLTADEWETAVESTQYAHYTSENVIRSMYDAATHLGFGGGTILEPGSGVGNFIGLMPDSIRNKTRFTGVERESIAGGIAKLLYPNQNIQQADFTAFQATDGYFDFVIGNPPFSSTALTDISGRKHLSGLSIHNYFFAKAVDLLREGGILMQVVTSSFLDAKGDKARTYIGNRAKLLGAIRLPNSAFMGNAGTDVTTDIIFLQKLPEAEWESKAAKEDAKRWMGLGQVIDPLGGANIPINQYFVDNPEMMLGTMQRVGGRYREDMPGLVAHKGDMKDMLAAAIAKLPANVYVDAASLNTSAMEGALTEAMSGMDVEMNGYFVRNDKLYQRVEDIAGEQRAVLLTPNTQWTEKTQLGEKKHARLVKMYGLRTTMRKLINAERVGDEAMVELRARLNEQYDDFVKDGLIHDRGSVQLFGDDPDYPLLASLERNYDPGISEGAARKQGIKPVKPSAKKADIFTKAVVSVREAVDKADSPVDALMVSIAEKGRIDAPFIGELLGRDGADVLEELTRGDEPELFKDPDNGGYVLRDEYLSGNVRKKFLLAQAAGMHENAQALQRVIPEDIPAHEIVGRIGAPWVPAEVYEDFFRHLLGEQTRAQVRYVKALSSFAVQVSDASDLANHNTYGVPGGDNHTGKSAVEIITALLNNRSISVRTRPDRDGRTELVKEATDEAGDKAAAIREKFTDWLMQDADRADKLARIYNDTVNNYVERQFKGNILTFPGKVPDSIIKFRRHQTNAIARILQEGRALLDHVVGSGKTFTVIGAAQELKRTGLARKSMIVVPNHLVKQWAADYYRLYPGANILAATKKDFERKNRRAFLARIATGNWDAVIIAHSSFGFIKPDPVFEEQFNYQRIQEIMDAINELSGENDQATKRTVKQLANMKERLEQRIKSLRDRNMDSLLDLGQLGVDQIFVDEAHLHKNLFYTTKMQNVRGLNNPSGSQRAYDMFIKTRQIMNANGHHRGVVFATGTPISNSMAEMYHMLRYLYPDGLADMDMETFDAWANSFAEVEQVWMQSLSGAGFKATNRMSRFVNAADLLRMYNQVADTVTQRDVQQAYREENEGREFPLPKLKGGRRTPVSLKKTDDLAVYMEEIAARAKAVEQRRGPPQKGEDNILSIMTDARKAAMDIRLVNPDIVERHPEGRIAMAGKEVIERYRKYAHVRGTQLIFSDMGTPLKHARKELAEYEELRATIAAGSDADTVARAELGDEAAMGRVADAEKAQEALDAKGQDWLDAIKAALRGFSIYDDMKAYLMENGVPENEIAFIHDYNTDDQKAALFAAVNSGKIRILLGSTAKMGAGTNVQQRLVAVHHLDVPWKPSDIEQREGRIIRQGNLFATPPTEGNPNPLYDPDFEIEILAYATQDSLDLFMWQVQEKKLGMINQLREGNVGREFDNAFEEMQMSAGEMQAAATSNPYLMEEIQLKDRIKKLERQQKSHVAQGNDLITREKKARKAIAELPAQIASMEKVDAEARAYHAALAAREVPATIDGQVFRKRPAATEYIRTILDEHEQRYVEQEKANLAKRLEAAKNKSEVPELDTTLSKNKLTRPVNIEGKDYTSISGISDRIRTIYGDADPIAFQRGDETYYTRSAIRDAVREDYARAVEEETTVPLGSLGKFEVSVIVKKATARDKEIEVYALGRLTDGTDLGSYYVGEYEKKEEALQDIDKWIRAASIHASGMDWSLNNARLELESAQKTLTDLARMPEREEWKGTEELAQARARYREVLKLIVALANPAPEVTPDGKYRVMTLVDSAIAAGGKPSRAAQDDRRFYVFTEGHRVVAGSEDGFSTAPDAYSWLYEKQGKGKFSRKQHQSERHGEGIPGITKLADRQLPEVPAFSRSAADPDVAFAHDFLVELADVDELFRYPLSHRTSREGVFEDVYPDARYLGEDTRPDERQESEADHRYAFRSPDGALFYVYERDTGEVFINVSEFRTGEGGSAVYAAVGNYAYNTGRRFIADPAGLTGDSLIRRTTNMLSLALRFGTTRHIAPGEQQLEGDRENGVEPLEWNGDDVAKTRALIHTFITTFQNKAPEFKDVRYDFNRREFIGRDGLPIDRATFRRRARQGFGRSARAGEATARRGILIKSLVSSESRERPGILEHVLNRARALVSQGSLDRSFSRQTAEATSRGGFFVSGLQKSQISAVVQAITRAWKNAPEIVIVEDMNDPAIPEAVRLENQRQLSQGATGQPEGFFAGGRVYIVASQIERPGDVARVLLHESLGHYGLRGLYGEGLNKILKQIAGLRRGDVEAMAKRYGLDMKNEADRLQAAEEVLAHLAQTRPESGFVQRAIAAIRAWLRENIPGFEELKLSDGEIIEHFLLPARRFVEQGGMAAAGELAGAFSRQSQTDSAAFKAWFKDSKVVDKNGKPLVLYRGVTGGAAIDDRAMNGEPRSGYATFASDNPYVSASYAHPDSPGETGALIPVFVKANRIIEFPVQIDRQGRRNFSKTDFDRAARSLRPGEVLVARKVYDIGPRASMKTDPAMKYSHASDIYAWGAGTQIKSAVGNRGTFDPANPDIRFSRSAAPAANAANRASVRTPLRERMDRIVDTLVYNFVDRFKPLRDIQKQAGPVPERQDASLAEERYSGTVRARTDDFHAELRDPLVAAIHEGNLGYEEVEEYLHALHAPSRNAAMREINPTQDELDKRIGNLTALRDKLAQEPAVERYAKLRRDLRNALADIEDGVADETLAEVIREEIDKLKWDKQVADYIEVADKLRALRGIKPFEGDNTALSGMSNAEAAAVVDKARKNGHEEALRRVSAIVDSITDQTRRIFVESGLERPEMIEAWNRKYDHYVPLHRDEVGSTSMPAIGQGFNIRGRESKRATGSTREVTDILAHVVAQHEAAIIRAEKTKVDRALYEFARAHPDPQLWTLDTAPMIRTVDPVSGAVTERVDPLYKQRPNVLTFKVNGDERTITFNERNEQAVRLAVSMKNLSAQQLGEVTQTVGRFTRFLATMSTTANPVFIARNFMRDLQTAYLNLSDTELAGMKRQVFADLPDAIRGIWDMSRGKMDSPWAKRAREFRLAGGQTGWMEHYGNIGERADALRKQLDNLKPGTRNLAKAQARAWWQLIEDANGAVENGMRLAAYVNARKAGLTEGRAASLAKNLTVNFNRHGAKGVELNMWYMFANASIQGSARIIKALSNKQVQRLVGGIVASGFLMDLLARSLAGDDDDDGENDYDQLPEHTKAMNFVFWMDDRPVTIPMPYGYNFFASVGRKMSEVIFRENYSPVRSAADLGAVFVDAFSPTGQSGSLLQYVAPTVADPFIQWAENRNFAGNPLRRQQIPYGIPRPEYQMGFRSTSAPAKWLAEWLNTETGGNEVRPGLVNLNPALFDFAVSSTLGGAGRTYLQAFGLPFDLAQGEDIEARKVPFANILLGAKPEYQIESKYILNMKRVDTAKNEIQEFRAQGDFEKVRELQMQHGGELSLIDLNTYTKGVLTHLRRREAIIDKTDPPDRHELKAELARKRHEVMSHFNKRYTAAVAD